MTSNPIILVSLAAAAACIPTAAAAVVVVAPKQATSGSILITHDITFDINLAGLLTSIVFNDWVTTADGLKTESGVSPQISLSLNGGAPQLYSAQLYDNLAQSFNDFTSTDGYFVLTGPTVSPGDRVTVHAGNYTLSAASGFNQQVAQTFTGEAFLVNGSGVRLSNAVAVPEVAPVVFGCLSLAAILLLRRR